MDSKQWNGPDGQAADKPIHITPINDLRDHPLDALCPCMPRVVLPDPVQDEDGAWTQPDMTRAIVVHNSYDGRETGEVCRKALDLLGAALANHGHQWTSEQRNSYEHAIHILDMHWPAKPAESRAV